MKLMEMRMSVAGARFSLVPGDVAEFTDEDAKRLHEKGYAIPYNGETEEVVPSPKGKKK